MIIVDARGMRCPWPAIRAARALRNNPGSTIEVAADDPAAERELRTLAENHGKRFQIEQAAENRRFRILDLD